MLFRNEKYVATVYSFTIPVFSTDWQCRGKLLLKVMRYNIVLHSKKVTNYVTFYGK